MYLLDKNEELTADKITKILQQFQQKELPRLRKYNDYYLGNQEIMRKYNQDKTKPCNRIVTNYCYNIVQNYLGYLTGIDISYVSNKDFTPIQEVLNYNDVRNTDSEYLRNALIYGKAYEVNYIDEESQERFKVLDSRECVPVYSKDLNQDLLYVIRFYLVDNIDYTQGWFVEVYDKDFITKYKSNAGFSSIQLIEQIPHYYQQVPISVFTLNAEEESIFDKVMSLQDAYNKLLSAEVDDFEAFCDAYLILNNCYLSPEDVQQMKEKRTLIVEGENASVSFLNKSISDTQIENMLANIDAKIHKTANSPNFADESFGTASGVALRYKLLGFENTSAGIVANMTKALQRRLELICTVLELKAAISETTWRDVQINFTRNLPVDYDSLTNTINQLRGIVSDKTLIALLPFVKDADAELAALQKDNAFLASMYSFQQTEEPETEPEEEEKVNE